MGVPTAAWPMHQDPPRNSLLITELFKVGLMVEEGARREEINRSSVIKEAARGLMASEEGDKMREKACELVEALQQSVAKRWSFLHGVGIFYCSRCQIDLEF